MTIDNSARRYLCLWLPFLTADRWRHERGLPEDDGQPLVFVEKIRGASCIAASDARAHALGLQAGLSLTDARARLPVLRVMPFDLAQDRTFLLHLADSAGAFTPTVALDEPNGLALDITGCTHLCGGEVPLVRKLEQTLQAAGATSCRIAVATTPDMARALARFSRSSPSFARDATHVHKLSVTAIECDAGDIAALKRAGLRTIGDVANRPSVLFTARFSAAFSTKLARVLGEEDRRITPLSPPPVYMSAYHCIEPVTSLIAMQTVMTRLASDVCEQLRARDEGGRLFESVFVRTDGVVRRSCIETSEPTRDPAALLRLYRDRLETLADPADCGFGYDLIRLEVLRTQPYGARQTTLDARREKTEQLSQLIDRLGATFGRDRVVRLKSENTHIPEGVQTFKSAVDGDTTAFKASTEGGKRPFLLFNTPHSIEVDPDCVDDLRHFRWRRVTHTVAHAEGPERIADEWWRAPSGFGTRDYFRVENTEGRRFWIFRSAASSAGVQSRWFLHGLFP